MSMLTHFQNGPVRYQPGSDFTYGYNPDYALNQYRLVGLMGVAAIGFPFIQFVGTLLGTCGCNSIGHYYSQYLNGIFIAGLVFTTAFLIPYKRGNESKNSLSTGARRAIADFELTDISGFISAQLASVAKSPVNYKTNHTKRN